MPAFEYQARDRDGRRVRGIQEADSSRRARQLLRERGLLLSWMRMTSSGERSTGGFTRATRLGASELALITRQLSTLIAAGLPLEEALQAVAAQSEPRRVSSLLLSVRSQIVEGYTLAAALAGFPRVFPELYRATVAAGERAGHLDQVLEQLADYTEARHLSRQRIQLALVYPLILLLTSLTIVGFLLVNVVPDIVKIFVDSGQPLPLLTRSLIAFSDGLSSYGLGIAMASAVLGFSIQAALRKPIIRLRWHAFLLIFPLVGDVVRAIEATRFASTLSILGKSAVPLVDALEMAATVIANQTIRARMGEVARSVREGGTLAHGLTRSGDVPPLMLHMIASGERAGELDNMLARAAEQQEKMLAARITLAVSLFEPFMLVAMGGVVLLIVLAILMPILSLNQLVS